MQAYPAPAGRFGDGMHGQAEQALEIAWYEHIHIKPR